VPADLRLTDVKNLRTEEAALTGESVPAEKTVELVSAKATVVDRESMAFSGTMAVSGRAAGIVVATGSETELGRINLLLASVSALETPLLRQIKKFGNAITIVIAAVSILVFAYGRWVKGMDFVEIFQAVVGIAVSVIPRLACAHNDHLGDRRAAHGAAQCHHPAPRRRTSLLVEESAF
jgi:magnesium-transporting ATPase (P-type)